MKNRNDYCDDCNSNCDNCEYNTTTGTKEVTCGECKFFGGKFGDKWFCNRNGMQESNNETACFFFERKNTQEAKADKGKLELALVPTAIIEDIAEVRMYGNRKYGSPDNWKLVERIRYVNALFRHFLHFLRDPNSVDEESGIPHYKHMACNMAFICEMMRGENK